MKGGDAPVSEAILIRPYEAPDEAAVTALWERCGFIRAWNNPKKDIARKLAAQPELFLVGVIKGEIVATCMAGYDGHRGWINYLGVDPARRKSGLGRAMMAEAERKLRALGCAKINLQVRKDNAEAAEFHRKIGFMEDAVTSFGKRLEAD